MTDETFGYGKRFMKGAPEYWCIVRKEINPEWLLWKNPATRVWLQADEDELPFNEACKALPEEQRAKAKAVLERCAKTRHRQKLTLDLMAAGRYVRSDHLFIPFDGAVLIHSVLEVDPQAPIAHVDLGE